MNHQKEIQELKKIIDRNCAIVLKMFLQIKKLTDENKRIKQLIKNIERESMFNEDLKMVLEKYIKPKKKLSLSRLNRVME